MLAASDAYLQVMHVAPGVFTPEEMAHVEAHGERLAQGRAAVPMPPDPEIAFLYDRVSVVAQQVNASIYQFALAGFAGPFQFVVDRPGAAATGWWMDEARGPAFPKLCLTVQLSDPDGYEGGDLEAHGRPAITPAPRDRGSVIVLPFYTLRRTLPVLFGVRRSAVILAAGPRVQ